MIKLFAVMLAIIVSQCAAKCINENRKVVCYSFEDFYNSFQEDDRKSIYFEIQSKEVQDINATILTKFPNIREINFIGSVNYITDLTFAAPSHLNWIKFENCELPIIRKNSFVFNSDSNVILSIMGSKVNYLEPYCFVKSVNLYKLRMQENNITKINVNVFNGTSIAVLDLVYNNIKFFEENALSNMPQLRELYLDGNFLTSFDAKLYLNNVPNLVRLYLSGNKIEFLNTNSFISIPELSDLLLDSNKIQRIENDAFNGLIKLGILGIANNSLYSLPESSFPYNGLPSLEILDIRHNRLNYLPKHFLLLFPKLKWIGIFENPWQCACYKDIMKVLRYTNVSITYDNYYLNGQRPVCVGPRTGGGKCEENIPDQNELYETFKEGLKGYKALELYM